MAALSLLLGGWLLLALTLDSMMKPLRLERGRLEFSELHTTDCPLPTCKFLSLEWYQLAWTIGMLPNLPHAQSSVLRREEDSLID